MTLQALWALYLPDYVVPLLAGPRQVYQEMLNKVFDSSVY